MFVVTGVSQSDGEVYCWVVDVVNRMCEVKATIAAAKQEHIKDYGKTAEESNVEFDWHELEGVVQR
ncbi:MAG: hypothetical protein ACRC6V_01170 [Bacteroidales bacterium]